MTSLIRAVTVTVGFLVSAGPSTATADVIVGASGGGNCAPFGCPFSISHFQQVYAASAFPGIIDIGSISFSPVFVRGVGTYAQGTYTVSLGTTTKAVNALDAVFAGNVTSPLTAFAEFTIATGTSGAPILTIVGPSFRYDPSLGNLLLDVLITNATEGGNVFFDSDGHGLVTSRAWGTGDVGSVDALGLVTTFGTSITPEPRTLVLTGSGMLAIAGFVARRRKSRPYKPSTPSTRSAQFN
jgi:hypothetical protein